LPRLRSDRAEKHATRAFPFARREVPERPSLPSSLSFSAILCVCRLVQKETSGDAAWPRFDGLRLDLQLPKIDRSDAFHGLALGERRIEPDTAYDGLEIRVIYLL
jgi:hypothetical protein